MKWKKINKLLIASIAIFSVLIILFTYLHVKKNNRIFLDSIYVYTEQSLFFSEIPEKDKEIINTYLKSSYKESSNGAGFSLMKTQNYSIFDQLYNEYMSAKELNMKTNASYVEEFNYIFRAYEYSMQNYNIPAYDYMYYVALKCELGEEYDGSKFEIKISNYIDDESGLFFFMDKNEDKDTKLLLTGKLLKLSKKYGLNIKKFDFEEKLLNIYKNYEFQNANSTTSIFNSGACLIYALRNYEDIDMYKNDLKEWFSGWKKYYEKEEILDYLSLINYSSFMEIQQCFEDATDTKVKEYIKMEEFSSLDLNNVGLTSENFYNYVVKPYKNILTTMAKDNITSFLEKATRTTYENVGATSNIDLGSTYYGTILSFRSGFEVNNSKVHNTILKTYNDNSGSYEDRDYIYNTYYYVMLLSTEHVLKYSTIYKMNEKDQEKIDSKVDEIIDKMLLHTENLDIGMLRVALEIKSNIRSYILKEHKEKIEVLIKTFINNKIKNSKAIDAIKIDEILRLGLYNKSLFMEIKNELYLDGGFICTKGEQADLKTTYLVYSLVTNHDLFDPKDVEIKEKNAFLQKLKNKGLYKYELNYDYFDLRSLLYGYMLEDFNGRDTAKEKTMSIN